MSFTELRLQIATTHALLRSAKDDLELTRAEAEQYAIDQAGGIIGKNESERQRTLTLALAKDQRYLAILRFSREYEAECERLEALLEGARDARRNDEWQIRARLVDALAGVQSDDLDRAGDTAFDDAMDAAMTNFVTNGMRH